MFTQRESTWLVKNFDKYDNNVELHKAFVNKFCSSISYEYFRRCLSQNMKLRRQNSNYKLTSDELAWVKTKASTMTTSLMLDTFNKTFKHNLTLGKFKKDCLDNGIHFGRNQKNKAGLSRSWNEVPIGTRSVTPEGVIWIKYRDNGKRSRDNWMPEQRYVWEQAHGKIPKDYHTITLDRNPNNMCVDNIACVSKAQLKILNDYGWLSENADITRSAIRWTELKLVLPKE